MSRPNLFLTEMKIIKKWMLTATIDVQEYCRLQKLSDKVEIINETSTIGNETVTLSKTSYVTTSSENQELLLKILYDNKLILLEESYDYWNY